ncbi:MAG: hypothetical protein EOM74_01400, partial [Methanomicrobia archaeon]|nr:hypothetical protein [Methanomicrobia archaeon]
MMKRLVKVLLITPTLIKVDVFPLSNLEHISFNLLINQKAADTIIHKETIKNNHEHYFLLHLSQAIVLGYDYRLVSEELGVLDLDVSFAAQFDDFDDNYAYYGDDLGSTYSSTGTAFAVWAPLAS